MTTLGLHGRPCIVAALLATASASFAQTADPSPTPPAELFRVEAGVFALRLGQSIDITDKYLLLALTTGQRDCLAVSIGGRKACIEVGERIDLTEPHGTLRLGDLFADRQQCFLDVVNIDAAKGMETIVTFRLHCV